MKRLSILLLTFLLLPLLMANLSVQAAEVLPETGTITNFGGNPLELTRVTIGTSNLLYVTENNNSAAIIYNHVTSQYKVYSLPINDVYELVQAPDGRVWFTNDQQIGMFDPNNCSSVGGDCAGNNWQFPLVPPDNNIPNIGPMAFDDEGSLWVGDQNGSVPRLYRVNQLGSSLNICTYDINFYRTYDLTIYNGKLWLGDWYNHRILRIDSAGNLTEWVLDANSDPDGLSFDANGNLWWADFLSNIDTAGRIGQLELSASTNYAYYYDVPGVSDPKTVSSQSGKIWYTDQKGTVGRLDSSTAPSTKEEVIPHSLGKIVPVCTTVTSSIPVGAYYFETFTLSFNPFEPTLLPDTSHLGFTIYTLPIDSKPYGMVVTSGTVFVTDSKDIATHQGRIIRFTLPQEKYNVFLPLILR